MADQTIKEQEVTLSKAELKDIQKFMSESASKDKQIEDLSGLVAELKKTIEKTSGDVDSNIEVEPVKTGEDCRLRKYDGNWVLGWTEKGIYIERNKLNEIVEFMDVIVQGKEKPVKMPLLSYINDLPQSVVKIKEKKELKPIVKDEGLVPVMSFSEKTGEHVHTGRKIRSQVIIKQFEFVFVLDGEKVTLHERFVNQ